MTRPSSARTELERKEDVALTWIEEWLRDIMASLEVMYELLEGTPSEKPRLTKIEVPMANIMAGLESLIGKVEKL